MAKSKRPAAETKGTTAGQEPAKKEQAAAPDAGSKTPLADRFREELKEMEADLEPKLQAAKDRLTEILHSDECNRLRAYIKEAQPKLAHVKNELAALARPNVTHRMSAGEGRYEDGK